MEAGSLLGSQPARQAGVPASTPPPFRAILLDDNPDDREFFRMLIRRHPAIELVAEVTSLQEALAIITQQRIDVVFLETATQGKPLIEECSLVPPHVKLIFITRHPAAAVQAFELDAIDFLLKPLTSVRFSETIRRLLRIDWQRPQSQLPPPVQSGSMLLLPFERGRRGVSLDEILLLQACGNYTRVVLRNGDSEIVLRSLAKWEKLIPMPPFLRVHRNAIVHTTKVRRLEEQNGTSVLLLDGSAEVVPVSRRCLPEVRQVLFKEVAQSVHPV